MEHSIQGTYVLEKINKIRWRPDTFNNVHFFVTGSWDNKINNVKLWDFHENDDNSDIYPFIITNYPMQGDVTEIKFINSDLFVVSSSVGTVKLLKIAVDYKGAISIADEIVWNKIHYYNNGDYSSCTSLACYDNDIATIGEDGRINFLTTQNQDIIRTIDADGCSLNCVTFLKHNEILTGNLRGLMKVWDLRCAGHQPTSSFLLNENLLMPTCVTYHPTQRHIIIAGDEEGSVTVWDLRQNTFPINLLNAHSDSISEIQFHSDYPNQLFSCSNSGELWHWVPHSDPKPGCSYFTETDSDLNPWLMGDTIKNKLEVYSLLSNKLHKPINTLDVNRNKMLCGCDNEAIYLINGINLLK